MQARFLTLAVSLPAVGRPGLCPDQHQHRVGRSFDGLKGIGPAKAQAIIDIAGKRPVPIGRRPAKTSKWHRSGNLEGNPGRRVGGGLLLPGCRRPSAGAPARRRNWPPCPLGRLPRGTPGRPGASPAMPAPLPATAARPGSHAGARRRPPSSLRRCCCRLHRQRQRLADWRCRATSRHRRHRWFAGWPGCWPASAGRTGQSAVPFTPAALAKPAAPARPAMAN